MTNLVVAPICVAMCADIVPNRNSPPAASLSSWPMEKIETLRPLQVTPRPMLLQKKTLNHLGVRL